MTLCSIFVICYSGIAAICAMYTAYNLLLTLRVHWCEAGARAFGCLVVACLAMPAHFAMPAHQRLVVVPCHACAPVLLLLDVHRRGAGSGFPVVYCEYTLLLFMSEQMPYWMSGHLVLEFAHPSVSGVARLYASFSSE